MVGESSQSCDLERLGHWGVQPSGKSSASVIVVALFHCYLQVSHPCLLFPSDAVSFR